LPFATALIGTESSICARISETSERALAPDHRIAEFPRAFLRGRCFVDTERMISFP
jgi:hypothetical protein